MQSTRRHFIGTLAAGAAVNAFGQEMGRVIVPFAPGGPADALARLLVEQGIGRSVNRRYVIENRPGAGGTLGTAAVARAPADGSTLLFIATSFVQSAALYEKPGYDAITDFAPIAQIGTTFVILCVRPDHPAKTLSEFLAMAKSKPVTYASAGIGSPTHLYASLLVSNTGINATHVPYRGESQALTDFLGAQVDFGFFAPVSVRQYIAAGKVRPLAITGTRRSDVFPGIPTIREAGLKGLDVSGWFGLFAPAQLPQSVAALLSVDVASAADSPTVRKWMSDNLIEVNVASQSQFAETVKHDLAQWKQTVRAANITLSGP